jgi:hypothetical protein
VPKVGKIWKPWYIQIFPPIPINGDGPNGATVETITNGHGPRRRRGEVPTTPQRRDWRDRKEEGRRKERGKEREKKKMLFSMLQGIKGFGGA